jgi:hypothetical protein
MHTIRYQAKVMVLSLLIFFFSNGSLGKVSANEPTPYPIDESVPEVLGPFELSIHPTVHVQLTITLLRFMPFEHEDWRYGISQITVTDSQTGEVLQQLGIGGSLETAAMMERFAMQEYSSQQPLLTGDSCPIEFLDMNFDTYLDLRLFLFGGTAGATYTHYLFNPTAKQFIPWPALDNETHPVPHPETKTIITHAKGGHAGRIYVRKVFSFQGEQLVLRQREQQRYDRESEQYIRVTDEYEKGEKISSRTERITFE